MNIPNHVRITFDDFYQTPVLVAEVAGNLTGGYIVGKFEEEYHVGNFKKREKNNFILPT